MSKQNRYSPPGRPPRQLRKIMREMNRVTDENVKLLIDRLKRQARTDKSFETYGTLPISKRRSIRKRLDIATTVEGYEPPHSFSGRASRPRDMSARPWRPGDQRSTRKKRVRKK